MFVKRAIVVALSGVTIFAGILYNHWFSSDESFEPQWQNTSFRGDYSETSHPLAPALELIAQSNKKLSEEVADYTCVMVRRERVDGEMGKHQVIHAKVRHEQVEEQEVKTSFGVYLKIARPSDLKGCEVLYVADKNDGDMLVRKGGSTFAFLTMSIAPTSPVAMSGNRYPITEFGLKKLVQRMLIIGEEELQHDECNVEITRSVQVKKRTCTLIRIEHPQRRDHFRHHIVRLYIDNETEVPFRYESYDWPAVEGGEPVLVEECTFHKVQLNANLSDAEFDRNHPDYLFSKS